MVNIPTITDEENELSVAALEKEPALTSDAPPATVMAVARWITVRKLEHIHMY